MRDCYKLFPSLKLYNCSNIRSSDIDPALRKVHQESYNHYFKVGLARPTTATDLQINPYRYQHSIFLEHYQTHYLTNYLFYQLTLMLHKEVYPWFKEFQLMLFNIGNKIIQCFKYIFPIPNSFIYS